MKSPAVSAARRESSRRLGGRRRARSRTARRRSPSRGRHRRPEAARARACSPSAAFLLLLLPEAVQRFRLVRRLRPLWWGRRIVLAEPLRRIVVGLEPDLCLALPHLLDAPSTRRALHSSPGTAASRFATARRRLPSR